MTIKELEELLQDFDEATQELMGEYYKVLLYYREHPDHFVEDFFGVEPTDQQREILKAVAKYDHVAVKSGHGIGKTATLAWIILWYLETHPFSKVPCTAPTQHQLYDVLWPEVAKWLNQSEVLKEAYEWTKTHVRAKAAPEEWFAVARSSSKPENLQGFHGDYLLFVVDEASGVKDEIGEVIEGAATNEGAKIVMAGNPTKVEGWFYKAFYEDKAFWYTLTFSSEESPLVDRKWIERMRRKYGRDSNVYRVRVLGEFPIEEYDVFIPYTVVGMALARDYEPKVTDSAYIGVDVARSGNHKTAIAVVVGRLVKEIQTFSKEDTMKTAGRVMMTYKSLMRDGIKVKRITIDDTGLGGGVVDRLKELQMFGEIHRDVEIVGVSFARPGNENYERFADLLWANLKEKLEKELSLPSPKKNEWVEELIDQLTSRKYVVTSSGKIHLEDKQTLTKRGKNSPDMADALALAVYEEGSGGGFNYKALSASDMNIPYIF